MLILGKGDAALGLDFREAQRAIIAAARQYHADGCGFSFFGQ